MPDVTVVIPTRNRLALLQEAVASVRAQTLTEVELVVVDDASDDGTRKWLEGNLSPSLRAIHLPERGERSAARNRGLREASGAFVLFLDDDDRLVPRGLERLVKALAASPNAVAAVGGYVRFGEDGRRERGAHPRRRMERWIWREALFHWTANPSRTLFRADVVRNVGGFREDVRLGEDWDLLLRVTSRGTVVLIPEVVSEYRYPGLRVVAQGADFRHQLASDYGSSLNERSAVLAARISRSRVSFHEAGSALKRGDYSTALGHLVATVRSAPWVVRSPLTRSEVLRGLAHAAVGSLAGGRITAWIRKLAHPARRAPGRGVKSAPARADPEGENRSYPGP